MGDKTSFEHDLRRGIAERLKVMTSLADQPDLLDRLIASWIAGDREVYHAAIEEIPNPDGTYPHPELSLWICEFIADTAGALIPTRRYDWAKTGTRLSDEELAVLQNATMPNGSSLLTALVDNGCVTSYVWFEILSGGPAEICRRLG